MNPVSCKVYWHLVRCACALVVLVIATSTACAQSATLRNGRVVAEFGDRGLTSLADVKTGRKHLLEADEFSVTINGQTFDSRLLAPPSHKTTRNHVITFTWPALPYQLEVSYEVQSGWGFVSKRIVVSSVSQRRATIDEVVSWRAVLSDTIDTAYVPKSYYPRPGGTDDYGVALRLGDSRGLLALVQNPFQHVRHDAHSFSIAYAPDLEWDFRNGAFETDRALLVPYRLTGHRLPATMLPEWKLGQAADDALVANAGMDEAEVAAYTDAVKTFLLYRPEHPLNLFVGWCANDYQIDVGTPEGRAEYKRLIDRAAKLGAKYIVYAPANSKLSRREESADEWLWEYTLWLGLGEKIRRNEWNPATDRLPPSVREMLDYAKSKGVQLVAYVYPVLPFEQNPDWLVENTPRLAATPPANPKALYANLAVRSFQDWLIDTMLVFKEKTGISGFAFDYTTLGLPGASSYAQWRGWKRVLEELRRRSPDIVIDGRQQYQMYGPWTWLAGSYPHPTYGDEQPESFVPFPDLHFDRVSAARQRYTAYRYRNYDFAPAEIMPGFIGHQTPRADYTGRMPQIQTEHGILLSPFRRRDWDYLGWKYSLLSSIATAGWNNVLNMIPARDPEENRYFSAEDSNWYRGWLQWVDKNKEFLRHTQTILGQPAIGSIDGTSAIVGERGFVFLFNPNGRQLTAQLTLDKSIGLNAHNPLVLRELYPLAGRLFGKPDIGPWKPGDTVSIPMDGASALVLELQPANLEEPMIFGAPGTVSVDNGIVRLDGIKGEAGTSTDLFVSLPRIREISEVWLNGHASPFNRTVNGIGLPIRFAGKAFRKQQQVGQFDPTFAGGTFRATFSIPQRVFDQLRTRRRSWPIEWTPQDYEATWLASDRLLLFVQIAEPNDQWPVRLKIDDQPIDIRRAYTALRPQPHTFVGYYSDVSLLTPDRKYTLELDVPAIKPGQFQGVFFENVESEYTLAVPEIVENAP